MKRSLLPGVVVFSLLAAACGPSFDPEVVVRPPRPIASSEGQGEGGDPCRTAHDAEPFIVDWLPTRRSDLELVMKDGVAVVSYDCTQFNLLKECKLPGSYAFVGTTAREEVLQLTSRDELQANVPWGVGSLLSEVEKGGALDLATLVIGRRATAAAAASRTDLAGSCAGATHFVRSVQIGAFTLVSGKRGQAPPAGELLKPAAGSTASATGYVSREGDPEACRGSRPDALAPPDRCHVPIRVELVPLLPAWPPPAELAKAQADEASSKALKSPCASGMVLSGSKCTPAKDAPAHLCKPDDERECMAQCDRGDLGSCHHLAFHFLSGKDLARDDAKAAALFEKACDGGVARACYARAEQYVGELATLKQDGAKAEKRRKAQDLANRACDLGDGRMCVSAAELYLREGTVAPFPKDPARAATLLRRGCDLGQAAGCTVLAGMQVEGKATAKDVSGAAGLLRRACDAGRPDDCLALGDLYRKGQGIAKDGLKAAAAFQRGCDQGDLRACNAVGVVYGDGDGVPRDTVKAYALFQKGCPAKAFSPEACISLAAMYEKGTGIPKDTARAAELYERVCGMGGCVRAAEIWQKGDGVTAAPERAFSLYERACSTWSEKKACDALGPLLEKKDKERAKAFYAEICAKTHDKAACASVKRLGGAPSDASTYP